MRFSHSLRFRLILVFIITILLFATFIMFTLPMYYKDLLNDQTTTLKESTLKAMEKNLESYFSELNRLTVIPYYDEEFMLALNKIEYAAFYEFEENDLYPFYDTLSSTLQSYLLNTRDEVLSTVLVHNNGQMISCSKKYGSSTITYDYPYREKDWYKKAMDAEDGIAFISNHSQDYLYKAIEKDVFSFTRLIIDPTTKEPLCVIMADASTDVFELLFKDIVLDVSYIGCIIDADGNLIYSNNSTLAYPLVTQMNRQGVNAIEEYLTIEKVIDESGWKMILFLSQKELDAKNNTIYLFSFSFILLEVLLTIFILFFLSKTITDPFNRLSEGIKEVEKGNLQVTFYDKGKGELALLGHSLNHMVKRLNDLINREYKARISQQQAKYAALQSQIQPHFLYNTLNGFIGLNRLGKHKELDEAIISLTRMLRYTLSQDEQTTIKEEMKLLKHYLYLQKLRFDTRLDYQITTDPNLNNLLIPKLLLQPLVENAIIHGIEPLHLNGFIDIEGKVTEEGIYLVIHDNGEGMDFRDWAHFDGIGLKNVRERLLFYYKNAQIQIYSEHLKGTTIEMIIPKGDALYEDFNS
ncbi:sensor histidine kinase [Vallitalea okinawensis]|uniref:sensor histidine kinase n=1 Tax=Vallitalea okinawensis TaxID=2078660 RepID=UPI000CFC93C0|nr:sensor histidine kinase [Vallitalea okinawensis]